MATGARSGSMIVVSKPYMCCGGTVATSEAGASDRQKRSAAAAAPCSSAPQGLAWAVGAPVEPEVKAMAAICPGGMARHGNGGAAPARSTRSTGSGEPGSAASAST